MKLEHPDSYIWTPTLICSLDRIDDVCRLIAYIPKRHYVFDARPIVFIAEEDLEHFTAVFNTDDQLGRLLTDDRIRFFIGPDCWTELGRYAKLHPGQCYAFRTQGGDEKYGPVINQVINNNISRLEPYTPTPIHLNSGFRVLVQKVQNSTVIGYAADKMAKAFRDLGCSVRFDTEAGPYDRVVENATIRAINEFKPDMLFSVHNPFEFDHRGIPAFTWVQDPVLNYDGKLNADNTVMPVLHNLNYLYQGHGAKVLNIIPMAADPADYPRETGVVEPVYDLSFVSHVDRGNLDPDLFRILLPASVKYFEDGGQCSDWSVGRVEGLIRRHMGEHLLYNVAEVAKYFMAYIERVGFRVYWMRKIVSLVHRNGLRLGLFGRGWEEYPEFKRYAKGPTTLAQTREIFRSTKVNLHLNPHLNMHQRVIESFLCGQFITFPEIMQDHTVTGICNYLPYNQKSSCFTAMNTLLHLLDDRDYRDMIVNAARAEILKKHTYRNRAETILEVLRNE